MSDSLNNFRDFLNEKEGEYIIYGRSNSGKTSLKDQMCQIMERRGFKYTIQKENTQNIEICGKKYKSEWIYTFFGKNMSLREIDNELPNVEFKSTKYKLIYLPYQYVETPVRYYERPINEDIYYYRTDKIVEIPVLEECIFRNEITPSLTNFRDLLDQKEGDYIIYGAPISGKTTMFNCLICIMTIPFEINEDDIKTVNINNTQYSTYHVAENKEAKISIRTIDEVLKEDDIKPNEKNTNYKFIYLPYTYVPNPNKLHEKLRNVDFFIKNGNIPDLEQMII